MMQKDKTLQFWDDFYLSEQRKKLESFQLSDNVDSHSGRCCCGPVKEWIVQPSDELFQLILQDLIKSDRNDYCTLPTKDDSNHAVKTVTWYKILEIGCGTSLLSESLCKYWDHHVTDTTKKLYVIATDVSPVCIEQQITLQQQQFQQQEYDNNDNENQSRQTKLVYQVLNITETHPEYISQFDMILDKGCFDTCLFRSKNTDSWINVVLQNIHSWLVPNGLYTIITPRSKIKQVRDYIGFDQLSRTLLKESQFGTADLEPRSGSSTTTHSEENIDSVEIVKEPCQYMYTCRRRNILNDSVQSKNENSMDVIQQSICSTCGVTYNSFCSMKGSKVCASDTKYWNRRWQGHLQHCKIN